jgi:hypothetical protein
VGYFGTGKQTINLLSAEPGRLYPQQKEREAMPYKRKTVDEWEIQGFYAGAWEMATTETTRKNAKTNIRLYREAEPGVAFRIKKMRVKIEGVKL